MRWWAGWLVALALGCASQPVIAQARGSVESRPHGPTAPPRPGPSRPVPASPASPFPSAAPELGPRIFPIRLFGLGWAFYDPYWLWAASGLDESVPSLTAPGPLSERATGGLQLDVEPRRALVYVDGRFVGAVDAFSGYYHHLDLPAGVHRVELLAPGYDPLLVDVAVSPDRTTTYQGALNRR
jgi:hypothetical protein